MLKCRNGGRVQQVLCDTSVFLALWAPSEKSVQEIFSRNFFADAKKCEYAINVLSITTDEIQNKFPFLLKDYLALCGNFFNIKKFREFRIGPAKEILELYNSAKKGGFSLSFNDCALAYASKKKKFLLLSWDSQLVEFAGMHKVDAKKPDELC